MWEIRINQRVMRYSGGWRWWAVAVVAVVLVLPLMLLAAAGLIVGVTFFVVLGGLSRLVVSAKRGIRRIFTRGTPTRRNVRIIRVD